MRALFITGGNGDIGSAIVSCFKEKGLQVIAPSSKELDLASAPAINDYFNRSSLDVDIFIHCAGVNVPRIVEEVSLQEVEHTMRINTFSFFQLAQKFIPTFRNKKAGHLLAISSLYGFISRRKRLAYAASKHALNGMIKTLALELGNDNIIVNSLSPGFIDTKLTRKNNSEAIMKSFEEKIPLGRLGKPQDIAHVAYFLCSPENTYVTGQNIIVDGGYCIGGFQNP